MSELIVAKTILAQLGNNKFIAMTGARNFVGSQNNLSFTFPRTNTINACSITLNSLDLYDVEFYHIRKIQGIPQKTTIKSITNIYADQLQSTFTQATGLYTHL